MNNQQLMRLVNMLMRGRGRSRWSLLAVGLIVGYMLLQPVLEKQFGISLPSFDNRTQQSQTRSPDIQQQPFPTGNAASGNAASSNATNGGATAGYTSGPKWSKTSPGINMHHVFEGEINRQGKAVGFHSRPGGQDPATARLVKMKDGPNRAGVYTAIIEVRDGSQWKEKFSSFFPDSMSADQVTKAILNAYNKSSNNKKQPWRGPSGHGFDIQGYTLSKGDINTAFPVYQGSR